MQSKHGQPGPSLLAVLQQYPILSLPTLHNQHPHQTPSPSPRLKNTLLPPRLPLLLPRRLTIPKRKPTRPLIRPRRLAHPPHLPSKQQRPRAKAEKRSIANHPRRESETPPAHQLRVQVESRDRLENHGHRRRRFAQIVSRSDARATRRRAAIFAAAAVALFAGAGRGRGRGGCGRLGPDGDDAGEDQV